MKEFVN